MITISRQQQLTACVKAGKGQPNLFDCGRQVLQLTKRSMGNRQAYLDCFGKQMVDTTKPSTHLTKTKFYLWLLFHFWVGCCFSSVPQFFFLFRTFEQVVTRFQLSYNVIMESFKTSRPLRSVSCIVKLNI